MAAGENKFGPIKLTPGVTATNASSYFFAALVGICLVLCVNLLQPYILVENLHIPRENQGALTGMLGFFQEVIVILAVIPFGWLADRIGRRPVFVSGFVLFALGFLLYPLADSVPGLYQFRVLIALGAAAYSIGLFSISADYPDNEHRGKWTMVMTLVQGITASLVAGPYLAKLPLLFTQQGVSPINAGQYAFWIFSAMGIFAALVMQLGLARPGVAEQTEKRSHWKDMLSTGIAQARQNPRIAVSYAGAFATRGDFAIITAFLMLWVTQTGIDSGLETSAAMAKAGLLFGLCQLAATLWALVMGPLLDRINRLNGFIISMAIASGCYLHMFFVKNPLESHMLFAVVLLGIAEMSTIMAGQVLITQEAAPKVRGRIVGVYSLFGAIGIMFATSAGGVLYDSWMPAAPFVLMGFVNVAVLIWAIHIRRREMASQPISL